MAIITGSTRSERIDLNGIYYWNGTKWVYQKKSGATNLADIIFGGAGNDIIDGGKGNDKLSGDTGNDTVSGGAGNDTIYGGSGNDTLYGGSKILNATLSGNDKIYAGIGNDIVYGGDGNDIIQGNEGDDALNGEAGNDVIDGGTGRDSINGGAGADSLTGGASGDIFLVKAVSDSTAATDGRFNAATGDTITDFTSVIDTAQVADQDKIDLSGLVTAIGHPLTWGGSTPTNYGVWSGIEGNETFVYVDTTGDGVADIAIKLSGIETLSVDDFIGVTTATPSPSINLADVSDTGPSNTDNVTSDNTPLLNGTAVANAEIRIYDNGTLVDTTTADTNGNWQYNVAVARADGVHAFTATTKVGSDPESAPSAVLTVTIDRSEPGKPTIDLAAASDSGTSNTDNNTKDNTPTISGTAEPLALVEIYDGATKIDSVVADASGNWTKTLSVLGDGLHNLTVKAIDAAGNVSESSTTLGVTIDTQLAVPTIDLDAASDTGSSNIDNKTSDTTPTLTGTAEANSTIIIKDGNLVLDTITADNTGAWSYTTDPLTHGNHIFTVISSDLAGNTPTSANLTVTIDTTPPAAPTIDLVTASDTGGSTVDNITSDNTPSLSGTAEKGAIVSVYDGTNLLGTTAADPTTGSWSFTSTTLIDGQHTLSAVATDAAGNESLASTGLVVTIDTAAPSAPTIDLATASDTGVSNSDNLTADKTPTLTGTAEANATITIFDGATNLGTTIADDSGLWSFTTTARPSGAHVFTATAKDAAGNESDASAALNATIDVMYSNIHVADSQISAISDDAEQKMSNGRVDRFSSDLEMANDYDLEGVQTIGLRFANVDIPVGAVITKAYIQFTVDERDFEPASLTIKAQNSANADTFGAVYNTLATRATTASSVTWNPAAWTTVGASGADQQTADISALVQEVVKINGWDANQAMAFLISGIGKRTAVAYDPNNPTLAPKIHIEYYISNEANTAPVAGADSAGTQEDTAVVLNLLTNDTDANNNALHVAAVGKATHGIVNLNADGTVTYTPNANYHGTDTFSYTLSDGHGGQSISTVTVNVASVNDAPEAIADLAYTDIDTPVTFNVLLNDLDRDGDAMSITAGNGAHGVVSIGTNGSLTYTPDAGYTGVDEFVYTVSDGNGGTDTATVTVNVDTPEPTITFAAFGDYGVNNNYEKAVADMVKGKNPDFIVGLGDNAYFGDGTNTVDKAVGQYYADYIGNYTGAYGPGSTENRFFTALSNHDYTDFGLAAMQNYFTTPESSSHNERYYDFVKGAVHFYVLNLDPREPDGNTKTSIQAQWLQTQLSHSESRWNVVIMPEAPYSSSKEHPSDPTLQWDFEAWGADLILSGDTHAYEHIQKDANNDGDMLDYVVAGTGGASPYKFELPAIDGSVKQYDEKNGALMITANDTSLTVEFWAITNGETVGTLVDSFTL